MITPQDFNQALKLWFAQHKREFPWRKTHDPYLIWVSEIMSQQTQIARVSGIFYPRFVARFPDVQSLAQASWDDIFPLWDGLGYYRRGQNMLKAAQVIVNQYDGKFPTSLKDLESLPGIGTYTACAIASFAFGQKVAAIDTNLSHLIRILWPQERSLSQTAQTLITAYEDPREWNSAMMDLAACLKSGQKVEGDLAQFFPPEVAEKFVPKRKKKNAPMSVRGSGRRPEGTGSEKAIHRIEVGIACIHRDGQYLVQTRPKGKSFTGFWEFPGGKREKGEDYRMCVKREILEEIGIQVSVRPHFCETIHEFENKVLILRFHRCQIQAGVPKPLEKQKIQWISPDQFSKMKFLPTNKECLEKLKRMRV